MMTELKLRQEQQIRLSWLGEQPPERPAGVTWGVPWKKGELSRDELSLDLFDPDDHPVPMQTWPTAYWPDGSVKWTAHAAVIHGAADGYILRRTGKPASPSKAESHIAAPGLAEGTSADSMSPTLTEQPDVASKDLSSTERPEAATAISAQPSPIEAAASAVASIQQTGTAPNSPALTVRTREDDIEIDTGAILCRVNRTGAALIREIVRDGRTVCSGGELVGIREQRSRAAGASVMLEQTFTGIIEQAVLESTGPIRAVVKLQGRHLLPDKRLWLPFTVRLYFYAGLDAIRMVHTFLYDGNPHQDYIRGLGIRFTVPMRGPLYNRHIRLAGDTGWFSESPKGLMLWRLTARQRELYEQQLTGRRIAFDPEQDALLLRHLADSPEWNSFKLVQSGCDGYVISKRTQENCSWLRAAAGIRARGLVYAGSEAGGLAIGVRHFWQKHPSALEVDGCAGEEVAVTAWLWSPDAPAMDLRHYDTKTYVESCYEGAYELRSTPYGIGNTNELMIWCCGETPDAEALDAMAREKEEPSLLVCSPERYHVTRALGSWSLPDRSTPMRARLEDTLDELIRFYQREIEQRRWYGFWDYGDVMHSYDPVRHTWKYDVGGCAWQNTELAPNYWLWYSFLRTGRADIFRMAEAMTRHTSEVDVYHIGEYAGLGSRHNVLHWGCGCKEARIGMAGLHRFYYYLTADERIGDIMDEAKDADYRTVGIDPMRAYFAKDEFPTHVRSGPDWAAFCSNWMVQWERHEDASCLEKMKRGIECLKRMPDRLLTGPTFGYDPKTGELMYMSDENYGHHLMISMGGAQVWTELADLLQDPEWEQMLIEYGAFYNLPAEEKERRTNGRIKGKDWNIPMLSTTMMAYAASRTNDAELARQAWDYLLRSSHHWSVDVPLEDQPVPRQEYVREIREIPWISTNTASQWSINTIICLEWIADHLPDRLDPPDE